MAKRTITIKVDNTDLLNAAIERMRQELFSVEPTSEVIDVFPLLPVGDWWDCVCGYSMPDGLDACVKCGAARIEVDA